MHLGVGGGNPLGKKYLDTIVGDDYVMKRVLSPMH